MMNQDAAQKSSGMSSSVRADRGEPIDLELPKKPVWVGVARLAAAGIAYRAGLPFDTIEDVKIIVAEAVSYCIQHGTTEGRLRLRFELNGDDLIITVTDPTFPATPQPPRDRNGSSYARFVDGLFLIRGLADEVEFCSNAGNGLTLRIRRGA